MTTEVGKNNEFRSLMDFQVKGREAWRNHQTEATAVGRWPLKRLAAFLERWIAQWFVVLFSQCLAIASFQWFAQALAVLAVSAAAPQSPHSAQGAVSSAQRLDAAKGRGHRLVLSNSGMQWDQTYPTQISGYTYLCINAQWWKWRCKCLGMKTPCPELLQSKSVCLLV